MGLYRFFILIFLFTISCNQDNQSSILEKSDLIGKWEALDESGTGYMLERVYCNAFVLRNNGDFAVYYWQSSPPDENRVDGHWHLTEGNKIVFEMPGAPEIIVTIINHKFDQIEIMESNNQTYKLYRQF